MVDQVDEEMKMAVRQNMQQHESPEPKRSKPRENSGAGAEASQPEESPEASQRRTQRELMAAAAEKRMAAAKTAAPTVGKSVASGKDVENRSAEGKNVAVTAVKNVESVRDVKIQGLEGSSRGTGVILEKMECTSGIADPSLSVLEADELFLMIFGNRVTKDVLAQWTNQGIR